MITMAMVKPKGMYRDVLVDGQGRVVFDRGWKSNTILQGCRSLIGAFFKNDPALPAAGIHYLAVGQGLEAWDTTPAPAPDPGTTVGLEDPYGAVVSGMDLEMVFLDDDDTVFTGEGATARLQITATLKPKQPIDGTAVLREFGLFARINGLPVMINCIRHPVIHKAASATLIRKVRLYF